MPKRKPSSQHQSIIGEFRTRNPEKLHVWSLSEMVIQAGLRGLPTSVQYITNHIRRGTGPDVLGTAGSSLLIDPQEGKRWITAKLATRAMEIKGPSRVQLRKGITAENFASL